MGVPMERACGILLDLRCEPNRGSEAGPAEVAGESRAELARASSEACEAQRETRKVQHAASKSVLRNRKNAKMFVDEHLVLIRVYY